MVAAFMVFLHDPANNSAALRKIIVLSLSGVLDHECHASKAISIA